MKYYVLGYEMADDGCFNTEILMVTQSKAKAVERLKNSMQDEREYAISHNWIIDEDDEMYFFAYEDGFADKNFAHYYLKEVESEKDRYFFGDESYSIEELRIGYKIITGCNNIDEFTDEELYQYMLNACEIFKERD